MVSGLGVGGRVAKRGERLSGHYPIFCFERRFETKIETI